MHGMLDLEAVKHLTIHHGEGWGYRHACRLLRLIEVIGEGLAHDAHALTFAVYLHDWGAFPAYALKGVDHAERSRQVASDEIMPRTALSAPTVAIILEAIERHDYRDPRPVNSNEALLLREADFLDFLGAVGVARAFAWGPNDLHAGYRRILARRDAVRDRFTLPAARALAEQRLERMARYLEWFVEEAFDCL